MFIRGVMKDSKKSAALRRATEELPPIGHRWSCSGRAMIHTTTRSHAPSRQLSSEAPAYSHATVLPSIMQLIGKVLSMDSPVCPTSATYLIVNMLPLCHDLLLSMFNCFKSETPAFVHEGSSVRRDPQRGLRMADKDLAGVPHGALEVGVHRVKATCFQKLNLLVEVLGRPALELVDVLGATITILDAEGQQVVIP